MGGLLSCLRFIFVGAGGPAAPRHPTTVTVNGATLRIDKLLGEGGYAYVFSATRADPDTGESTKVALKRFVVRDAEALSNVMTEIELHKALSPHATIVNYIDHQRTRITAAERAAAGAGHSRASLIPSEEDAGSAGDVWLVLELAPGGSLRSVADQRLEVFAREQQSSAAPVAPFTAAEIKKIVADVLRCLAHLHGQRPPVAHHDVKLENVLIGADGRYKLCDFGSAKRHSITARSALQVNKAEAILDASMTMLYRPPEACDLWQAVTIDTQADMWALGVMMYTLLAGKMPFDANPRQIIAMQYDPLPQPLREHPEYKDLCDLCIGGLLVQDPARRLDVDAASARLHNIDPAVMPTPFQLGNVRAKMQPMPW
jgi:AP2-associated kinase